MSTLQVDISPFANRGQLLALEFAYGGGISDSGDMPATTAAQVAELSWVSWPAPGSRLQACNNCGFVPTARYLFPFVRFQKGIFGDYSKRLDPWQQWRQAQAWLAHRSASCRWVFRGRWGHQCGLHALLDGSAGKPRALACPALQVRR